MIGPGRRTSLWRPRTAELKELFLRVGSRSGRLRGVESDALMSGQWLSCLCDVRAVSET